MIKNRISTNTKWVWTLLFAMIAITGWANYFDWQSASVIFGLLIVPYILKTSPVKYCGYRYLYWCIGFAILTAILPVKTFLYFAIVFGILFLVESAYRRSCHLVLVTMLIISPIFNYVTTVFTFPLKLKLSALAANLLTFINPSVVSKGNIIGVSNAEFSVDDACMGLSMVTIGLLLGVFLLAYFQYKTQKIISLLQVFLSLLVIFILVISANLFRIIFLVQFQVLPDNILHEIIGVLCFAAYVLLPALLVIKFIIKKSTVKNITRLGLKAKSRADEIYYFLLLVLLAIVIIRVNNSKNQSSMLAATGISLPGYSSELINNEIIKAENGNALIYVKHIKGFYSTEHSPMICWRGSGYEMASVQEMKIGKRNVYSGILKEGKNKLYTAWWFDNGDYQTTDQLDWRWKVLRGAQEFSIVNVTTTSTAELVKSVERVMADNLVRHARLKK